MDGTKINHKWFRDNHLICQGPVMRKSCILTIILLALLAGSILSSGCVSGSAPIPVMPSQTVRTAVPGLIDTVPDLRQSQPYSCGASALQAVLNYWGIDKREGTLIQELGTTEDAGTPPESIVRVARAYGLDAGLKTNLTLGDLESAIANKTPVIIDCQAWRDESEANLSWENIWEDGHYMVVVGIDRDNVYFEDPSLLGSHGIIPREEFVSRWHDYEGAAPFSANSTVYNHAGIFIRGSQPAAYPDFTHVD